MFQLNNMLGILASPTNINPCLHFKNESPIIIEKFKKDDLPSLAVIRIIRSPQAGSIHLSLKFIYLYLSFQETTRMGPTISMVTR